MINVKSTGGRRPDARKSIHEKDTPHSPVVTGAAVKLRPGPSTHARADIVIARVYFFIAVFFGQD